MSNIYDKVTGVEKDATSFQNPSLSPQHTSGDRQDGEAHYLPNPSNSDEVIAYKDIAEQSLSLVNDVVLKNYLSKLDEMDVVPIEKNHKIDNIVMYKISKMVYDKEEYATDKFSSVIGAMSYADGSIYLIVDGKKNRTDFYLGVKGNDENRSDSEIGDSFIAALKGQFPGVIEEPYSITPAGAISKPQDKLIQQMQEASCISSCVGVPSLKSNKGEYDNSTFVQGIEKLVNAMQGQEYTAVILATRNSPQEVATIRRSYEQIYTELSAMATQQLAYSTNESMANAYSRTKGYSDSTNQSKSIGKNHSVSTGQTHTEGVSQSETTGNSESKENFWGKFGKFANPLMQAGAVLTATGVGAPLGIGLMAAGGVATIGSIAGSKTKTKSSSTTRGTTSSDSISKNETTGESEQDTLGTSHTDNFSTTDGTTSTIGESKNFTITIQNKQIQDAMKRIDKQLERLELCESTGLWSTGAYFFSYDGSATSERAASIFRSIVQGEQSGVEVSAINTWSRIKSDSQFQALNNYVTAFEQPLFQYKSNLLDSATQLTATSFLSSSEVSMVMGLPRKSVPGLPVSEHVSLAKEVVHLDGKRGSSGLELGCIFDQGCKHPDNLVRLDKKSLTQHVFVTGSTGCGKSNTIYQLVDQIRNDSSTKFMIIEPVKGEYKDVFGNEHVYGTNPLKSKLLKLNPFRFPEGVHVLEHIDRLIEIFNVCWPMYAAMPAVLKDATIRAYEDCGWDLYNSANQFSNELFPSFADLLNELSLVIDNSAYSEEVKSNYAGSLLTRVKSLTNGINKEIFCGNEIGDQALFDENVIIDLSRVGSQETKSLIMGLLIMRLNEYRANQGIEANSGLRHVTIIEEAHNILKRCSQEQNMEGANVAGKSVEMISNAIAEMRTYGEGFIIVDQSPSAVDISAIKNTNTKIIMRLPEESDRRVVGKSAAMKDDQIDEIAKLATGVAVVYQNDWESPVLCQINPFNGKKFSHTFDREKYQPESNDELMIEVLKLILKGRVSNPIEPELSTIEVGLGNSELSTVCKWLIFQAVSEYKNTKFCEIWKNYNANKLSSIVTEILAARDDVQRLVDQSKGFEQLHDGLSKIIHRRIEKIPSELDNELCCCLMRDFSLRGESNMAVFNAWYQSIKSRFIQ